VQAEGPVALFIPFPTKQRRMILLEFFNRVIADTLRSRIEQYAADPSKVRARMAG
jgi:hypothetical protein